MGAIYVVTSGEYSEYTINIVTTNEELANAYAEVHSNEYVKYRVEEYFDYDDIAVIDEFKNLIPYYKVVISVFGDVIRYDKYIAKEVKDVDESVDEDGLYLTTDVIVNIEDEKEAIDKAIKIAKDRCIKYLAQKFGISIN